MLSEIKNINKFATDQKPSLAIIGGSKFSLKLAPKQFIERCDFIILLYSHYTFIRKN